MFHVKMKALAGLIRTFLETACIPRFRQSLYHQLLLRYHVFGDTSIENPGYPPFYNQDFFSVIHQVHHHSPLNIQHMSEKQWYRFLMEEKVTMELGVGDNRQLVPCRVEVKFPCYDWEKIWPRIRLKGLGPELSSFLFKVVHDLLPTQERVARTSASVNGMCKLCLSNVKEDLLHTLIKCPANQEIGEAVLLCLSDHIEDGVDDQAVLQLHLHLEDALELPVVWFLAVAWSSIWESRKVGRRPELYKVRADLEAKVSLLRETSHSEAAEKIASLILNL